MVYYAESADNNGSTEVTEDRSLNAVQRAAIVDILRQQSQRQQQPQQQEEHVRASIVSDPGTASNRHHVPVKKPVVPAPVQHRPISGESDQSRLSQTQSEPEADREKYGGNVSGHRRSSGDQAGDDYENIDVIVHTAAVLKDFDDVLTESDVPPTTDRRPSSTLLRTRRPSQDEAAADMLSLAEHARQKLIQRRSREISSDATGAADHNAPVAGFRPVPQQRSMPPSDSEAEQFKQLLAAKAANRRLPEEAVSDQSSRPVPVSRSAIPRSTSVDAGATAAPPTWKPPPSVKQKTRSGMSAEADSQQSYREASRRVAQRRSVEINRQSLPPSPPITAAHVTSDDFDLPPPPEEYSNLPALTAKPYSTLPHGRPPTISDRPVADWQREIADRFHHPTRAASIPLSITDDHDLPPPPSGFHDDIPAYPAPSRAQPLAPIRTSNSGGFAGNAGGLAGTVSRPMSGWSRDDVVHWLATLNMTEHCAAFQAASVNGQRLVHLTDDDLYALGVTQFGQRKMLQRAIENRGDDS